ncbi:MAG: aminotransferase class V-fold PLP-dependent enzyme [Microgenomates group bacterium]
MNKFYYFDWATYPLYPKELTNDFFKLLKIPNFIPRKNIFPQNRKIEKKIDDLREKIAKFLDVAPEEIFFVKNATEAFSLTVDILNKELKSSDIFLYNFDNHKKINQLVKEKLRLKIIEYKLFSHSGDADYNHINKINNKNIKAICVNHLHGVYGLLSEIEKIKKRPDQLLIADLSHSISRVKINLKKLNIDIAFFSGYKLFGLEGAGVIFLSKSTQKFIDQKILDKIKSEDDIFIKPVLSMVYSLNFINKNGIDNIHQKLIKKTQMFIKPFRISNKIEFLPGVFYAKCATGYGIISFRFKNIPSSELVDFFESKKIYVRLEGHCYQNEKNFIRISLHFLTKDEEIEYLIKNIQEIEKNI